VSPSLGALYRLGSGDGGDESGSAEWFPTPGPAERDDLPYKVELWDDAYEAVEQVLAVTADSSIGYGAYYAAIRQFPNRNITLRHKNRIISRSIGRGH
jgi:hypothetical protein